MMRKIIKKVFKVMTFFPSVWKSEGKIRWEHWFLIMSFCLYLPSNCYSGTLSNDFSAGIVYSNDDTIQILAKTLFASGYTGNDPGALTGGFLWTYTINGLTWHHKGLDFRARSPFDIYSPISGVVIVGAPNSNGDVVDNSISTTNLINFANNYGVVIVYNAEFNLSFNFQHLSRKDVIVGQSVSVGDKIGASGKTAPSYTNTGYHLHVGLRAGKTASDGQLNTISDTSNFDPGLILQYSPIFKIQPTDSANKSSGEITITGNNFGATPGIVKVAINSLYSFDAVVNSWSDTIITAKIFNTSFKWEHFTLPVTITVYKNNFIPGVVGEAVGSASYPFKDVPLGYWADEAVQNLYRDGIVTGNGSGQYDPTADVTRSEFLTMLLRAKLGYSLFMPPPIKPFDDVPLTGAGAWFAPYADYAKYKQPKPYVNGNTCADNILATCFRPNDKISRFEAAVMATNVFELTYYDMNNQPYWPDWNRYSYGYAPWIAFTHGIMNGYKNGNFGTNDPLTRDQAAVVVNKAMTAFKP